MNVVTVTEEKEDRKVKKTIDISGWSVLVLASVIGLVGSLFRVYVYNHCEGEEPID